MPASNLLWRGLFVRPFIACSKQDMLGCTYAHQLGQTPDEEEKNGGRQISFHDNLVLGLEHIYRNFES